MRADKEQLAGRCRDNLAGNKRGTRGAGVEQQAGGRRTGEAGQGAGEHTRGRELQVAQEFGTAKYDGKQIPTR